MAQFIHLGGRSLTVLFPDLLPPHSPVELEELESSVIQSGIIYPLILDEDDGLIEGITRGTLAAKHNLPVDFKVIPGLSVEQKRALCQSLSRCHRNFTPESQHQYRMLRASRVRKHRDELGMTFQQIAALEGISNSQVGRDLEATAPTPAPSEPAGGNSNGRTSSSSSSSRNGSGKRNGAAPAPATAPPANRPDIHDRAGRLIPKQIEHLFSMDFAEAIKSMQQFKADARRLNAHYPFLNAEVVAAGIGELQKLFEDAITVFVCPKCNGGGCRTCKQSGGLPEYAYMELPEHERT